MSEEYLHRHTMFSMMTKDAALAIGDRAEQYYIIQGTSLKMHQPGFRKISLPIRNVD